MVECICQTCGKTFDALTYKIKNVGGKYCSNECYWNSKRSKVECICQQCGKAFNVKPCEIKRGDGKYCSRACNSMARRTATERICQTCGKAFNVTPSGIKNGRKYCSRDCRDAARRTKIERICLTCGKTFSVKPFYIKRGEGKYCSRDCMHTNTGHRDKLSAAKKNMSPETRDKMSVAQKKNKGTPEAKARNSERMKKHWCDPETYTRHSMANKKGWENPEAHAKVSGDKCYMWKGGVSFFPYCEKFNDARKQACRNYFGNRCICCGKHVTENITGEKRKRQISLSVHHIDHDKEQGCSGKPFNLVPLCHSCHAKENAHEEEYRKYINHTLHEGFKWGIWNKQEYIEKVMY